MDYDTDDFFLVLTANGGAFAIRRSLVMSAHQDGPALRIDFDDHGPWTINCLSVAEARRAIREIVQGPA